MTPGARLDAIVAALGGELTGLGETLITRLAPLESADHNALAFVAHVRYAAQIETTQAAALIVSPALRDRAAARKAVAG